LKTDGTVVAWGSNSNGQISVPPGLGNVVAIAASDRLSVALRADGSVVRWGVTFTGAVPFPTDLSSVTAVASSGGSTHVVALKADGTVVAWGNNRQDQCSVPAGLENVVAIATGSWHSLALKADGSVVAWGYSGNGQLFIPPQLPRGYMLAGSERSSFLISGVSPSLTTQPRSQTVAANTNVSLNVTATGAGQISYQWRRNGVAIVGATYPTLTLTNVQLADAGSYSVLVRSGGGFVLSSAAVLTVHSPLVITIQPQSRTLTNGASLALSVAASGGVGPHAYQWRFNGSPVANGTSAAYAVSNVGFGHAGAFDVVVSDGTSSVTSTPAFVTVSPVSRISNLSILTQVSSANPLLTLGMVIGGSGTVGEKPVLVRAVGPSLTQFGVNGALADPRFDLLSGQNVIVANDNWAGLPELSAIFSQVGAFLYTSVASRDAAGYAAGLPAGNYTVRVTGNGVTGGVVIAEVYDATPDSRFTSATPRLINVSALRRVDAGENLTVGFVVVGAASKQVLVRAVGPTLGGAPFNLGGVMPDPRLDLFSGQNLIASNDDWGGSSALVAAFGRVGAFALSSAGRDAALVTTLPAGNYTAQVSGVDGASGFTLVEVYEVPETPGATPSLAPAGFASIPAGTFAMGDGHDSDARALPSRAVTLAPFYIAQAETTWSEWVMVRDWAVTRGYPDLAAVGAGKGDRHPVQSVSWHDVIKWLNAKSEKDGLTPVYYTNDAQTTVYRTGVVNVTNSQVQWVANGYRLPTEAEWECAARGGVAGRRFPWGNTATHQQANYYSSIMNAYDVSGTRAYHPSYNTGNVPYTAPVGSFPANEFGLFETAGNVGEWCWDWYGRYGDTGQNPLGPISGENRVIRGGGWYSLATDIRSANRSWAQPQTRGTDLGFRLARSAGSR
jgi:formylglycine-generating enzyme required for sulfatase activity